MAIILSNDRPNPSAKHVLGPDGGFIEQGVESVPVPGDMLSARAAQIAALLAGLRESVNNLDIKLDATDERATTSFDRATVSESTANHARHAALGVIVLLLAVVALTIWLTTIAFGNRGNIDRLNIQQDRLNVQQDRLDSVTSHGICGIASVFLDSSSSVARERFPQGPAKYDQFILDLRQISTDFNCST